MRNLRLLYTKAALGGKAPINKTVKTRLKKALIYKKVKKRRKRLLLVVTSQKI